MSPDPKYPTAEHELEAPLPIPTCTETSVLSPAPTSDAPHSPPPLSPQEAQNVQKAATLTAKIAHLEVQIAATQAKIDAVGAQLGSSPPAPTAAQLVKRHIKLLHDYNEIRDVGRGLLGMVADRRGVSVRELYEDFGVGEDD